MNNKIKKLIFLIPVYLISSGGFDHGTSAGKGNFDLSITWNPFNYFEQGQSYAIFGYGLTKHLDIHSYYSQNHRSSDNFYGGLSYQFLDTEYLDFSTAFGVRAYTDNSNFHLFFPQLLYTIKLSGRVSIGGSLVNIKKQNFKTSKGITKDVFLMLNIYENEKYKINITAGGFNPVLWEPKSADWYPTYSIDIKVKK